MKTFIFLALLMLALVYADHHEHHDHHVNHSDHGHTAKTEEDFKRYHEYCVTHHKIPAEAAQRYRDFEHADDEQTHKYMTCLFDQYGFVAHKAHFDDQAIHEQLSFTLGKKAVHNDDDETHSMVNNCINALDKDSKLDPSSHAYRVSKCIFKDAPIKWY